MKNLLFLFTVLALTVLSCKEEKKIEIIQDYDKIYLSAGEVDSIPKIKKGDINELTNKLTTDEKKIKVEEVPFLEYTLYINEKGEIDKLRAVFTPSDELTHFIVNEILDWSFEPARIKENPVKSRFTLRFLKDADGKLTFDDVNEFLIIAEKMPEIIGGLKSLQEKIVYPEAAKNQGISGKVYLLAYIDETGKVVSAKVLKGIGGGCDEAALEALKSVSFTPAMNKGKPVKVQVAVPVVFQLN